MILKLLPQITAKGIKQAGSSQSTVCTSQQFVLFHVETPLRIWYFGTMIEMVHKYWHE